MRDLEPAMIDPLLAASAEPHVQAMVGLVNQRFDEMPDKVACLNDNLSEGLRQAALDPWPDQIVEEVYAQGYALFEAEHYDAALPIALHLSVNRPLDPRFMFMAGLILQLRGDPLLAATFFSTALMVDPTSVPAAFRLAECYATIGETDEARQIFEIAIDMGRDILGDPDDFFRLQRALADKLSVMD